MTKNLKEMQAEVREVNEANGWFSTDRTFGDDIALLHSEISEAFEAYRGRGLEDYTELTVYPLPSSVRPGTISAFHKREAVIVRDHFGDEIWSGRDQPAQEPFTPEELLDLAADGIGKPEGVGSEFADILIRLLDSADRAEIDLDWEYARKIAYNRTRSWKHGSKRV